MTGTRIAAAVAGCADALLQLGEDHMAAAVRRGTFITFCGAFAAVAAAGSAVCVAAAAAMVVLPLYGPVWATLAAGGSLAVASLGTIIAAYCIGLPARNVRKLPAEPQPDAMMKQAKRLLDEYRPLLLVGAVAAGMLAGGRNSHRK